MNAIELQISLKQLGKKEFWYWTEKSENMTPRLKPGEVSRTQLAVFVTCGSKIRTAGVLLKCHYIRVDKLSV